MTEIVPNLFFEKYFWGKKPDFMQLVKKGIRGHCKSTPLIERNVQPYMSPILMRVPLPLSKKLYAKSTHFGKKLAKVL